MKKAAEYWAHAFSSGEDQLYKHLPTKTHATH
jgi:hypothetical protein